VAVSAALLAAGPAQAGTGSVPAGYDLFATDPEQTTFTFQIPLAIPAGFFAPGSEAFVGTVRFAGEPLGTFMGHRAGDADTVVQRLEQADLPAPGSSDTIPIQIVALSLRSVVPIAVTVGTEQQEWDVAVDLSRVQPPHGQMTIVRTSDQGGTFDSQLFVLPRFTFTHGDETRVLDTGELLPPGSDPALLAPFELRANGVPWRDGCRYPALGVPGLNDGFCPGLTPGREKQLTIEQAQLARHGVYPAQPLTDHFKCYDVRRRPFRQRTVTLGDQFRFISARVLRPLQLCNPVQKNQERIENTAAHLKCYAIRAEPFDPRSVVVRNQFGDQVLAVGRPETLCVPSTKRLLRGPGRTLPAGAPGQLSDHFACYQATGASPQRTVRLADQFHVERVRVLRPVSLCLPARKNEERLLHPLHHLACYTIEDVRPRPFRERVVRVTNQFGREVLRVVRPRTLCVPSLKVQVQPPPEQPPPPPCTGSISPGQPDGFLVQFSCDLSGVDGFALVLPVGILAFTAPPELSCNVLTTTNPMDTLACSGPIPPNTVVAVQIRTDPPLQPGQGGQLFVNQGTTQLGPYAISGLPQVGRRALI
jgi:hypothetical protein